MRARGRSRRPAGAATTSSTGTPSTVTPTARRSACSITATICGSAAKRSSSEDGCGRGADHGQLLARVAPAAHIAGRLPVERGRDRAHELPGAVEQQCALRSRLGLAGESLEEPRLGLRADAADGPQAAGRCRLAQLVGRPDAERSRDLDRALRAEPEVAAEADETPERARARARPAPRSRPSRRARAAASRSPGRSRAARGRARRARARRPGRASRGSSRPRGGRHGPCRDWHRRAPAARRRRPGGRRSGGCPPVTSRGARRSTHASCRSRSIRSHGRGRGCCTGCRCSAWRGGRCRRGRGRRRGPRARAG